MLSIYDIPTTQSEMMNRDHAEFIDILNRLHETMTLNDDGNIDKIDTLLEQLLKHTEAHFSKEEDLMLKANFPPYPIHKSEHDRILKIIKDSIIHWKLNHDKKFISSLIDDLLPQWLIQHVSTMDSITATYVDSM